MGVTLTVACRLVHAYIAGMQRRHAQYTLRGVPDHVDRAIRERAASDGQSLNTVALEAMERGLGLSKQVTRFHDLDHLAGSWVDDPEFDRVIAEMDVIDDELW
jgi:plasmid stability protein